VLKSAHEKVEDTCSNQCKKNKLTQNFNKMQPTSPSPDEGETWSDLSKLKNEETQLKSCQNTKGVSIGIQEQG
jgi:hypothetical protein